MTGYASDYKVGKPVYASVWGEVPAGVGKPLHPVTQDGVPVVYCVSEATAPIVAEALNRFHGRKAS